jgi:hypothetical protein
VQDLDSQLSHAIEVVQPREHPAPQIDADLKTNGGIS